MHAQSTSRITFLAGNRRASGDLKATLDNVLDANKQGLLISSSRQIIFAGDKSAIRKASAGVRDQSTVSIARYVAAIMFHTSKARLVPDSSLRGLFMATREHINAVQGHEALCRSQCRRSFKDIQSYKRAHSQDIKRTSKPNRPKRKRPEKSYQKRTARKNSLLAEQLPPTEGPGMSPVWVTLTFNWTL